MKRCLHYIVLAALLVAVPLLCCICAGYDDMLADVAAFPPRCDDWIGLPERLWEVKCPFNWYAFVGMSAIAALSVLPFLRRVVGAMRSQRGPVNGAARHAFPWFGWIGLGVMAAGWVLSWTRLEWFASFQRYSYIPLWAGFILLVNALCVKRCGRSPLTSATRAYLWSFPASSLFWWFFEYLNRYVWNWFYIGVRDISPLEYVVFATVCFASVLPGVTAVAWLLGSFGVFADEAYCGMAKVNIRSRTSVAVMSFLSAAGLTGIVFFPQFAYPLLWISPLMVFVLVQVLMKERSALDALADGNWAVVFRFAVAALICGVAWETWNYYSLAKWVYTIPWVHRWKIWEMPLLGFAGYLPFGVECVVVAAWIDPRLTGRESDIGGSVGDGNGGMAI